MLKLSPDTTNSINICQEEIYHPTTAGSKVSILLSRWLLWGRHRGSDRRQADGFGFTSVGFFLFPLQVLHVDIFMNKIYLLVMTSHTSSVCVFSSRFHPVSKVLLRWNAPMTLTPRSSLIGSAWGCGTTVFISSCHEGAGVVARFPPRLLLYHRKQHR